jgi:hypothetical protein
MARKYMGKLIVIMELIVLIMIIKLQACDELAFPSPHPPSNPNISPPHNVHLSPTIHLR